MQHNAKHFVPEGCFSRIYRGKDGIVKAVAYHTPSRSVAILEGDSATIWQLIFDGAGSTETALKYIIDNGSFERDAEGEARIVLNDFLTVLSEANLLVNPNVSYGVELKNIPAFPSITQDVVNAREDVEAQIAQFMADNRICYSLTLELTYRCNERCIHCYCPEDRKLSELSTAQISGLLDEFRSMGGMSLLITGGEVFARNDIKRILHDLANRNIVVSVISNLTMADQEDLDLLAKLKPRSVGCSIYSADPEVHDGITRSHGSWHKSIAALRTLNAHGVPVLIKSPLMHHTIHGWRQIEALASEIGCEVQFDVNISPRNDCGRSPLDLRTKDSAALADLYSSRHFRIFTNDGPISITPEIERDRALLCGAGAIGLAVAPDGTTRACIGLMNELGKWPQHSLCATWNHSPFFKQWSGHRLKEIERCSKCRYFCYCNRCPGSWKLETGSEKQPADYTCFLARIWSGCIAEGPSAD